MRLIRWAVAGILADTFCSGNSVHPCLVGIYWPRIPQLTHRDFFLNPHSKLLVWLRRFLIIFNHWKHWKLGKGTIMSKEKKSDLESQQTKDSQKSPFPPMRLDSEYQIPTTTKFAYLSFYFLCNVLLTIYNKAVLGRVGSSPFLFFPYLKIRRRPRWN